MPEDAAMQLVLSHLGAALGLAFAMFWQVLWPLGAGFLLSAVVETFVSKRTISAALGRDDARSLATAATFGAASSSCSYAAVALGRSLFRKGATLRNTVVFEFASTNLVFELGLVLLVLLGWQFLVAQFAGGLLMIVLLAILFCLTLRRGLVERARRQAARGLAGRMEGHAAMDMSVAGGSLAQRIFSGRALTAISHYFFMNVYSLWFDLLLGFVIAGALGAWIPASVWTAVFLPGHGSVSVLWSALLGPLVAMASFVCSVGNVPLAAVLWRSGLGFGGVVAFIFGDLIIPPILDIHRRYYSGRVSAYLFAVSYLTMVVSGLVVGVVFEALGLVPHTHALPALTATLTFDAGTVANIVVLLAALLLLVRFIRTGGVSMLRTRESPDAAAAHAHH